MIISLFMEKAPEGGRRHAQRADVGSTGQRPGKPAREEHEDQQRHRITQFVKRRIRTLRMSPKVAMVAMSDEPP
jgi:hypothetical protein